MGEEAEAVYEYARRGKFAEVKQLLDTGVPPDGFMGYDGSTAFLIAARSGHGDVMSLLLERKASLDARTEDGSAPLWHAVSGGSPDAVRVLLATGADPSEANEDGVTPLILASEYGQVEIVRMLLDARADVNSAAEEWGSPLDTAKSAGHADVVNILIAAGGQATGELAAPEGERRIAAGEKWGYDAFDGEKSY
mmetsp:Transcript_45375/g.105284  ORF Transcript_45375/g.105284 Transcript_45375/m.105284 type:complete len:194 (-) Transcript_45375:29-610(-)